MPRATENEVRAVLRTQTAIDLVSFLETANVIVDNLADLDTGSILNARTLKRIEVYLAAHCYSLYDQEYQSKSTGKASASFQGQTGLALDYTRHGQMAKILDITGNLSTMGMPPKASVQMLWLGTAEHSNRDENGDIL